MRRPPVFEEPPKPRPAPKPVTRPLLPPRIPPIRGFAGAGLFPMGGEMQQFPWWAEPWNGGERGSSLYSELYDLYHRLEPSPAYRPSTEEVAKIKDRIEKLEAEIAEFIDGLRPKPVRAPADKERDRWLERNPAWAKLYREQRQKYIDLLAYAWPKMSRADLEARAAAEAWDDIKKLLKNPLMVEEYGRPRE